MLATLTPTNRFRDSLVESFNSAPDGYWYPAEGDASNALVRIQYGGGSYSIERRRGLTSPWVPVVTADLAEFDAANFSRWRVAWPMVA